MSYYSNNKNKKTGYSRLTEKLITHTHTVYNEHHLFAGVYHKPCEYFSSLFQFNHCTCCGQRDTRENKIKKKPLVVNWSNTDRHDPNYKTVLMVETSLAIMAIYNMFQLKLR